MSAENYTEGMYWGDKTPFYLRDIDLLKKGFPYAKFIHIIRDPRDRCLSVYKTWGKNLYRAASGWYSDVSQCRKYAKNFPHDYMEVFYEDLLKNPEEELRRCTKFLSLSFENEIVKLQSPSEKHGNTSKVSGIVSNNSNKVINELSSKKIKRLEEIVFPLFKQTPYNAYYANKYVPYSKFLNIVYKLVDYVSFRIAVYVKKY